MNFYLIVYLDQSCLGEHTPIGVVKSQAQHSKVVNFQTLLTYYLETGRQHHYVFLKIQGFTNNVVVFTHELVRCATHKRLRKLNIQNADFNSENFILQE